VHQKNSNQWARCVVETSVMRSLRRERLDFAKRFDNLFNNVGPTTLKTETRDRHTTSGESQHCMISAVDVEV